MPSSGTLIQLDWLLLIAALGSALLFSPWRMLQFRPIQNPWMAALVVMPWLWWAQTMLPTGMALHLSGACLLALMVGWPLAVLSMVPIALAGQVLRWMIPRDMGRTGTSSMPRLDWADVPAALWHQADALVHQIVWLGLLPATLALGLGLLVRRFAPPHLFVYILGRSFIATALAIMATGTLAWWLGHGPQELQAEDWLLAWWLLGWGEATSTGMLVAIFVAFRPHWLLTYSDARYLPLTRH